MSLASLGTLSDSGTAQTITASGGGNLILAAPLNSFTPGTNFVVTGGASLAALGQQSPLGGPASGPLGSAPIALNDGALMIPATSTSPVTFDVNQGNAVTLSGSSDSIIAGNFGIVGNVCVLAVARSRW